LLTFDRQVFLLGSIGTQHFNRQCPAIVLERSLHYN